MSATLPREQFAILKLTHASAGQVGMLLQIASGRGTSRDAHERRAEGDVERLRRRFARIARATPMLRPLGGQPGFVSTPPAGMNAVHLTYLEALQTLNGSGPNQFGKYKSAYMRSAFHTEQVDAIYGWLNRTPPGLAPGALAQSLLQVDSYGGAINSRRSDATPIPQRSSIMKLQYQTYWNNDSPVGQGERGRTSPRPKPTWAGSAASTRTSTGPTGGSVGRSALPARRSTRHGEVEAHGLVVACSTGRSPMRMVSAVAAPLSALALLLAGCSGGGAGGSAASQEPSGPSTPGPVTVTRDVRFAAASPERARWSDPLLDVYAPVGGEGLPLVVFLPAHGLTKDSSPAYAQLATALAGQGAVVAVANWTQLDDPPEILTEPEAFVEVSRLGQAVAGCAVSFAAEHAGDYGADPSRLVLAGELFGANAAGMIALGEPDTLPGCSSTAEWAATGLAGVNGLWMAAYPPFDDVAAAATASQTPWALLDAARPIPVALMVTEAGIAVSERCGGRDAEWLVARDPSGAMRARLDEAEHSPTAAWTWRTRRARWRRTRCP